jgi:AraC-like DNA-binding protein
MTMNSDRRTPHLERSGIDTSDPDVIQKYLDHAYTARFSIEWADTTAQSVFWSHARTEADRYSVEEFRHDGQVRLRADHVPWVVALTPVRGRIESVHAGMTGVAGPGEWVLASTGVAGVHLRLVEAEVRSVVLDRTLVAEVAAEHFDEPSHPLVRFTSLTPADAAMAQTLGAAERFVRDLLSTAEVADVSILLGAAGRMTAGAVLAAFPNDLPLDTADDEALDGHPALLEQAIDFIQHNAARDIGIGDVAAAVYLTPRTVQYMFRKHLGTTPTAYLRDVRLKRAHEELIVADRTTTTVAAVAVRWGFAHTGRFAVLYRNAYGKSPHETLRR